MGRSGRWRSNSSLPLRLVIAVTRDPTQCRLTQATDGPPQPGIRDSTDLAPFQSRQATMPHRCAPAPTANDAPLGPRRSAAPSPPTIFCCRMRSRLLSLTLCTPRNASSSALRLRTPPSLLLRLSCAWLQWRYFCACSRRIHSTRWIYGLYRQVTCGQH